MKTGYVYSGPHKELSIGQKGGVTETFIKAIYIKRNCVPKKLCEYDSKNKKMILLIDNANYVIDKSKMSRDRKEQLVEYLKNNILGLPDFIILTPGKNVIFAEVKYNKSFVKLHQEKRHKELKSMGYDTRIERMGKITPLSQEEKNKMNKYAFLKRIINKLMFWRKPKLVTSHKYG